MPKPKKQVNVVHVIPSTSGGGAELLVKELNRRLPHYGIRSDSVYFLDERNLIGSKEIDRSILLNCRTSRSPAAIPQLRRIIKQLSAHRSIIHCHLTWPFFYVPIATLGLNLPLFYTEHSTHNKRRNYKALRTVDRTFYRKYRKIICISEAARENLRAWLGEEKTLDIDVVPNGARLFSYLERVHFRNREAKKLRLVSVGSLNPHKGFEISIKAIKEVVDLVDSYRIVGDGPLRAQLQALIDDLGLTDIVHLVGWSDNVEIHLAWADLQLIPSRWEGFGLTAVEGMSTGLPVLAASVEGLKDTIGNLPYDPLVQGDAIAWASAIRRIFDLPEATYRQAGLACHRQAQRFSISKMVEEYASRYLATFEPDT